MPSSYPERIRLWQYCHQRIIALWGVRMKSAEKELKCCRKEALGFDWILELSHKVWCDRSTGTTRPYIIHMHLALIVMRYCERQCYYLTMVDRFSCSTKETPLLNQTRLFQELSDLTGATHIRTTGNHLSANDAVEHFHHEVKATINYHKYYAYSVEVSTIASVFLYLWNCQQ